MKILDLNFQCIFHLFTTYTNKLVLMICDPLSTFLIIKTKFGAQISIQSVDTNKHYNIDVNTLKFIVNK